MGLSPEKWHERFSIQAGWTQSLRAYLLSKADFAHARHVLDVGCGTGALEKLIMNDFNGQLFAVDINFEFLKVGQSSRAAGREFYYQADARQMPFQSGCFDLSFCHFVLLWMNQPIETLNEMKRVTRPGGMVLALAEPDYGGRVDFPYEFSRLGALQETSLQQRSAHTRIGRELAYLFHQSGLKNIEAGVLGGNWSAKIDHSGFESEWEMLFDDLSPWLTRAELEKIKNADLAARKMGERILFIPTFYAIGTVPPDL